MEEIVGDILQGNDIKGLPVGKIGERNVLLDNDVTRITYYTFGPGEENRWHAHPYDFIVMYFDEGNLESMLTDGKTITLQGQRNGHYRIPAGTRHRAKNHGDKQIRLVEVEFKDTDIRKQMSSVGGALPTAIPNVPDLIPTLETKVSEALVGGDIAVLREFLADNVVFIHENGDRDDLAALVGRFESGVLRYKRVSFRGTEVFCPSADTAVTTGAAELDIETQSAERSILGRYTATWVRDRGIWRIVAIQVTPTRP
jgi:quercetin dioxygenase-like cupin family protein/ketosteroid isomerase-like protein